MKNKELEYQKNAVEFAINHLEQNETFNLQAPTGSGKTFIIASLVEKYIHNQIMNNSNTTFLFIAPSTGKLEHQGYEKITNYLNKGWVNGFGTKYIGTTGTKKQYLENIDYFQPNNVYFFGWQMFKKGTKITELESEHNNIHKVIWNTKERNIKIVLIIDEAHIYQNITNSEKTIKENIIKSISPYKIINVSATLEHKNIKPDYKIEYESVREECAIKKQVIISSFDENINNITKYTKNELLILSAIKKQEKIKEQYRKNKISKINPLILIQIPNDVHDEESLIIKEVKNLIEANNYKKDLNYAIWLNNEKTKVSKENITNNDSTIEILIFKQAIAIGWDVPRANMLVRLRDTKERSFNIQTLGRILRNQFFKYYDNQFIDNAFVFTDDEKYKNYIIEESICVDEKRIKKIHFSRKAKDNDEIKINKLLIEKKYEDTELIERVSNKLIDSQFFETFISDNESLDNNIYNPSINIDSKVIFNSEAELINAELEKKKKQNDQLQLLPFTPKETLVFLYIKYKKTIKSTKLINDVMDRVVDSLYMKNITTKRFFKLVIKNWNKYFKEKDSDTIQEYTLKSKIESLINEFISNRISFSTTPYIIPNDYEINAKYINEEEWDNINTYEISLSESKLESKNEQEFYKQIRNSFEMNDHIHVFRNGIGKQDYYIEYLDLNKKIRRFYPDFLVINTSTRQIFITEAKGVEASDIDKNSKLKIKTFNSNLKLIDSSNSKYTCSNFLKVSYDKSKEDLIFWVNDESGSCKFYDVKKKILEFQDEVKHFRIKQN